MADTTSSRKRPDGPRFAEDLRRIELFKDLPQETLEILFPLISARWVRARRTIEIAGAFDDQIGICWSGAHNLVVVAPNSASVTLASVAPGDAFGYALAVLGYKPGDGLKLIVLQSGTLLQINARKVLEIAETCPKLSRALFVALATQGVEYASRVYELAALDLRTRLQAQLLRLSRDGALKNGRIVIKNAPTHAALAAQIGAGREAITRHMRDMAVEGLIEFQRGVISITNLERLSELDLAATGRVLFDPRTRRA